MSDNPFAESPRGDGPNPFYDGGGQANDYPSESYGGTMQDAYASAPPPAPAPAAASKAKSKKKSAPPPRPEPSPFNNSQSQSFGGERNFGGGAGDYGGDIESRENALAQREAALRAKEAELAQILGNVKPPNWPVCKPILYHDIQAEIPAENQSTCRFGYYLWILSTNAYFWNAVVIMILMISDVSIDFVDFIFAGFIAFIGIYASWRLWYQSLYSAMMTEKTTRYISFFLHFLPNIGLTIWAIISIPGIGSMFCGVITMGKAWSESGFLGIITLIVLVLWSVDCALSVLLIGKVFQKFRSKGGVEKVKAAGQVAAAAVETADNMDAPRSTSNVKQTNVFV